MDAVEVWGNSVPYLTSVDSPEGEEVPNYHTTVTVPVWQLSGGEKVSSTLTLSVHAALAEDVKEIFTEIYNDPEQFPIHDVGGYSWRGDTATGEHNCGTAIDINANENYQIRDGQIEAAAAGSREQPLLHCPRLLRGAHLRRARLELGRRCLGLQQ